MINIEMTRTDSTYEELVCAYKRLFGSEDGKLVFDDLAKRANFLSPVMNENGLIMAHNEGKRDLILFILNMIHTDLEATRADRQSTEDYDV